MGSVIFQSPRPITPQEYEKIIGTEGKAPLPGKRLSTGMLESGLDLSIGTVEDHATFHIIEDLDRDGKTEDFYLRVKTEGPVRHPKSPPASFKMTLSLYFKSCCESVSTIEGIQLAVLKNAFIGDVTGDGIQDIILLTDNTHSRSSLDSLLRGATVLEGKKN